MIQPEPILDVVRGLSTVRWPGVGMSGLIVQFSGSLHEALDPVHLEAIRALTCPSQIASFGIIAGQLRGLHDRIFVDACDACRGTGILTCPHVRREGALCFCLRGEYLAALGIFRK